MRQEKIGISVVIPCYNEEKRIGTSLLMLEKFFKKQRNMFVPQFIIVDDGSVDTTYLELYDFYDKGYDVEIIMNSHNHGKGNCLRQGALRAKYQNILFLDADLSCRPEEILMTNRNNDLSQEEPFIIAGQRIQTQPQTMFRQFVGFGFSVIANSMCGLWILDTQCPYKLLHNIPRHFFRNLKIKGFAIDIEILYKAKQKKIPIIKQKVQYFNSNESKVTFRKAVSMFFELVRIRKK